MQAIPFATATGGIRRSGKSSGISVAANTGTNAAIALTDIAAVVDASTPASGIAGGTVTSQGVAAYQFSASVVLQASAGTLFYQFGESPSRVRGSVEP